MSHAEHLLPNIAKAIQTLEAQRSLLGDSVVDAAIAALRATHSSPPGTEASTALFTGERKLITIMFADLSGFTALSEQLDPEEVRALMNDCFDELVPIVQHYDGTIDKFIGDEIMALFGAPRAHERHAELACYAALDLMTALEKFNRRQGTDLQMHIGINTGLVIAGGIGSEGRRQYSVMGDAVNLAARLKDAARPGEIFVGGDTHTLTSARFDFFLLPPLRLKGKSDLVQVYGLLQVKAVRESGWEGRLRSALVGREAELAVIQKMLDDLEGGRGGRLALIGEAGIGKSRLVAESRKKAGQVFWVEGRALPYTRQNSYQLVAEILHKMIGVNREQKEAEMRRALSVSLQQLLPGEAGRLFPYLASLLRLSLEHGEAQAVRYLDAERLRERIYGSFREYLQASAARQPLVLVWEDLHWIDPSSMHLLESLLDLPDEHPVLLLLLFRPRAEEQIWEVHRAAQLQYGPRYQLVHLDNLSQEGCTLLARNLLRVESLSEEVERLVQEKAEGNPFFVEELLRSLLDQGLLFLERLEIQAAGRLDGLKLPTTLQGVIASRIDQLSAADKRVLQVASVIGRFFSRPVLIPLLGLVDASLRPAPALQALLQRGLIRWGSVSEQDSVGKYVFHHAVTHEVAYQSLLLADRRRLHLLAGETIEKLTEEEGEEQAATLALHFENADEGGRAVPYLKLAAERAHRLFANEEAIGFYRRAIKQAKKLPDPVQNATTLAALYEKIADILQPTGKYEEALEAYAQAQASHPADNWIAKSRLERKMGLTHNPSNKFERMLDHFKQAKSLLQQEKVKSSDWWYEWIQVHIDHIWLFYWLDQPEEMQSIAKELKPDLEAYGTQEQQAQFLSNLSGMYFRLERFLLSEETIKNAVALYEIREKIENLRARCFYVFMAGFSYLWYNEVGTARHILEEGLVLTEQIGDIVVQSRYLTYLTVIYRRLGLVPETKEMAQRSLDVAQQAQMLEYIATAYANFAWLYWKKGDLGKLEKYAQQAYDGWSKLPQTHASLVFAWTAAWPLAACHFRRGDLTACVAQFEEILHPRRKRMDPELEDHLQKTVKLFQNQKTAQLTPMIKKAFLLAEQYTYL